MTLSAVFIATSSIAFAHPTQVAFLNHFYAVVDSETVSAVERSSYLSGFIDYEKTTVSASDGESWTGRYLQGKSTYIELFGPDDYGGAEEGDVGLAFGTDRVGAINTMARHLFKDGAKFSRNVRRRNLDGQEVGWFRSIELEAKIDRAEFWAMEYVADYLDHPAANKEVAEAEWDLVSRERYNRDDYLGKLVEDVTYVAFHVSKEGIDELIPLILAAGYEIRESNTATVLLGQEAEIALFHADEGMSGLKELQFSLNRSVAEQHIERIGNSELRVGPGDIASWTFTLPARLTETTDD